MLLWKSILVELHSPEILAFLLGIFARCVRSDLKLPDVVFNAIGTYFLFGIGLCGGSMLAGYPFRVVCLPILGAMILGALAPRLCRGVLHGVGPFSGMYAAVIASHFGFLSTVTFYSALVWLREHNIACDSYLPVLVPFFELSSLLAAMSFLHQNEDLRPIYNDLSLEILSGKSILLLVGGTAIGVACGADGYKMVAPFFSDPFEGISCLLLMELGVIAVSRLAQLNFTQLATILFLGVAPSVIGGITAVFIGHMLGLSLGGSIALGAIAASSSYVSAAIAIRVSSPNLNPDEFFTAALSVSLPFNLLFGFPLFHTIAEVCQKLPPLIPPGALGGSV